jgi:hypothetical protein
MERLLLETICFEVGYGAEQAVCQRGQPVDGVENLPTGELGSVRGTGNSAKVAKMQKYA